MNSNCVVLDSALGAGKYVDENAWFLSLNIYQS